MIVARCFSLIVRVLLKKGRRIYINDGIWASLSDSWTGKITLPARLLPDPARRKRNGDPRRARCPSRSAARPAIRSTSCRGRSTCRETVDTGDWIEIGHIGAYSLALRTRFNGFYPDTFVEVTTPFEARRPGGEPRRGRDHGGLTRDRKTRLGTAKTGTLASTASSSGSSCSRIKLRGLVAHRKRRAFLRCAGEHRQRRRDRRRRSSPSATARARRTPTTPMATTRPSTSRSCSKAC